MWTICKADLIIPIALQGLSGVRLMKCRRGTLGVMSVPGDDVMTVGEVAEELGVSQTTVRNWATQGRLTELRTEGGHRRFSRREVRELARDSGRLRGRPSVLVIDDDSSIRYIVAEALGASGIEVVEAASGLAGLSALDERNFDLVLVDLMMPGLDGAQVVRTVRGAQLDVPILAFSALGDRVRDRIVELGADAFLAKPFSIRDLIVACRSLITTK